MLTFVPEKWARDFLAELGNFNPSKDTLALMLGWMEEEGGGTTNTCQFNALNTEEFLPGCWICTDGNIKAFPYYTGGIYANLMAISNGLYPHLRYVLSSNSLYALDIKAISSGIQMDLTMWVNGNRSPVAYNYIASILALANKHAKSLTS